MTISDLLSNAAHLYGESDCMVIEKKRVGFVELHGMACAVREYLKNSGILPGDRVILLWNNGPEYAALYFGVLMAGGVIVPLNPANYAENVKAIARHCSAKVIAATERAIPHVEGWWDGVPIISDIERRRTTVDISAVLDIAPSKDIFPAEIHSKDLAMILYTSGTTGHPKGVMLSHLNLLANTRSILSYLPINPSDRTLAILPFYYSYGNSLLLTHISAGGALVIENKFAFVKKALMTMESEKVTGFSGVPSHFSLLISRSDFLGQEWPYLRYLTCAGGWLPLVQAQRIRKCLPDTKLFLMYGQTEGAARLSSLNPDLVDTKPGSIGKGIPGVELRVVDADGMDVAVGEKGVVVARGDNIMQGYFGDPEGTAEVLKNGWLYTGDIATVDAEGFIYIKGRSVEFIKSGGYRISPMEVEEVILQHSSVLECAVVGLPDELLGESITAIIVLKDGNKNENFPNILTEYLSGKIPQYMMPRKIMQQCEIPKTESGKIRRIELREQIMYQINQI